MYCLEITVLVDWALNTHVYPDDWALNTHVYPERRTASDGAHGLIHTNKLSGTYISQSLKRLFMWFTGVTLKITAWKTDCVWWWWWLFFGLFVFFYGKCVQCGCLDGKEIVTLWIF